MDVNFKVAKGNLWRSGNVHFSDVDPSILERSHIIVAIVTKVHVYSGWPVDILGACFP